MKYLTLVVPCYNSQAYMRKCIDTLLHGGEDVEIIIVDDGSTDETGKIADEYKEKYPSIVKVIHKENGGHGSGINAGLDNATGLYFKVVDSDDWLDVSSYQTYLNKIKENYEKHLDIDVYFTNFVYENVTLNEQYEMDYSHRFPVNKIFSWNEVHHFKTGQYVLMHAMTYSLNLLKRSKIRLLEKTFYVDNIFAFKPLAFVSKMYFMKLPLYRYFIGRSDQSVNLHNMASRYDQQLRVMRELCINMFTLDDFKKMQKKQRKYLLHMLGIYSFLTMCFVYAEYNNEKKVAYNAFLKEFKTKNKKLYNKIYHRSQVAFPMILIPPLRRFAVMTGYKIVCKITKWG